MAVVKSLRQMPLAWEQPPAPVAPVAPVETLPPRPDVGATAIHTMAPLELWVAVQLAVSSEASLLQKFAALALHFTPRISLEPPDALVLEVRGSIALFGGLRALLPALKAQFTGAQCLAMAPTPLAALALARGGRASCITNLTRLDARLAPLPLSCLRWPEEQVLRLRSMGLRTIGQVKDLPRAGFARRFGSELLDSLDRLRGQGPDLRVAFAPVEGFKLRREPGFETTRTDSILQTLSPMLLSLEEFLQQRQRGVTALLLKLTHRHSPPSRCLLRLASPQYKAAQFGQLFDSQLQRLQLPEPVRCCELHAGPLFAYAATSEALWKPGEHGGGAAAQMPEFFERLRARLGEHAVHGLRILPGHRPESIGQVSEPRLQGGRQESQSVPWAPRRRPLWLLPAPLLLESGSGETPLHHGVRLVLVSGPERVETGWWDSGDVARDYYVASDDLGARLWIFRNRVAHRAWYLHGLFA